MVSMECQPGYHRSQLLQQKQCPVFSGRCRCSGGLCASERIAGSKNKLAALNKALSLAEKIVK